MARRRSLRFISGTEMGADEVLPTWEGVARDHGQFIYTVAYRLCGRHDEAEDLVQRALVRVERGLERYEPGNLRGWLSRITTNVFLDETRRKKRRPVHFQTILSEFWPARLRPMRRWPRPSCPLTSKTRSVRSRLTIDRLWCSAMSWASRTSKLPRLWTFRLVQSEAGFIRRARPCAMR